MNRMPLADPAPLSTAARRTRLHWAVLAASLVALTVAAALLARNRAVAPAVLPASGSTVVVIDLSGSTQRASRRIASTLLRLTRTGSRRLGLVVFSDTAYEALPLGTPIVALRDWLTLLADGTRKTYPWLPFTGGTVISSGLSVARRMLLGQPAARRHVVLVSDLVDDPNDLPKLQSMVALYQREQTDLRVIRVDGATGSGSPVNGGFPRAPNAGFVSQAAARTIGSSQLVPPRRSPGILLVVVVAAVAVLAAAYELSLQPLAWRRA